MNPDIFCLDIPNQISNDNFQVNSDLFIENNYEFSNNAKIHSNSKNNCPLNSNNFIPNFLSNTKNDGETNSEKENEKNIKLNFDICNNSNNNLNNNYICNINNNIYNFNCNCLKCRENISYNDNCSKILFEDYFLNFPLNYENNQLNNNENKNYINLTNKNDGTNFSSNNKNYKIDINQNYFFINNSEFDNDLFLNKEIDNKLFHLENEKNYKSYLDYSFSNDKPKTKTKVNNNIYKINLGIKRKIGKRQKDKEIIQFGHPIKINYKTMKQKLNIHKKLDFECRKDTFLLMHNISKLKQIIKKLISKKNIKDKIYFQRINNIYINSILSLQHREYAQDITGYKLI